MRENDVNLAKSFVLLALAALLLTSAVVEGYANCLQGYVIAFFAVVVAGCVGVSLAMPFRFLLSLILLGFVIGFFTQAIGVTSDLWCYDKTFVFAALSWSFAAVVMEGISATIRSRLRPLEDKPVNVVIILLLFFVIPVTLRVEGNYWEYAVHRPVPREVAENDGYGAEKACTEKSECFVCKAGDEGDEGCDSQREPNLPFWFYYLSLVGFAIATNYHRTLTELLSFVLAAWIMGGLSEWVGASAGLWHFRTGAMPPLFLVLGCWPLEFLAIRGLASALLVREASR
jgi:hypothetical protein